MTLLNKKQINTTIEYHDAGHSSSAIYPDELLCWPLPSCHAFILRGQITYIALMNTIAATFVFKIDNWNIEEKQSRCKMN